LASDDCAPAARVVGLSECTCALHVLAVGRLSRSPAAYKTVTSYQARREGRGRGRGGGAREGGYNYTLTLASRLARALFLVLTLISLLLASSLSISMLGLCSRFSRAEC
jgi:hypothetical protein